MARGGKRVGAGRKRHGAGGEPMVSIRVPERVAEQVTTFAREVSGSSSILIAEPRRRRRSSDRRPASKAIICNVRMSKVEQEVLRQRAAAAGYDSLQEFLYSQVVANTPVTEPATAGTSPTVPEPIAEAA